MNCIRLLACLCRVYRVLLITYPPSFRRQYGSEMTQLFRDRCRDILQKSGPVELLPFLLHTCGDWIGSWVRECVATICAPPELGRAHNLSLDGGPRFYASDGDSPGSRALIIGVALSLIVFFVFPKDSIKGLRGLKSPHAISMQFARDRRCPMGGCCLHCWSRSPHYGEKNLFRRRVRLLPGSYHNLTGLTSSPSVSGTGRKKIRICKLR